MSPLELLRISQEFQQNMLDVVNIKRNAEYSVTETVTNVTKKGAVIKELSEQLADQLNIPNTSKTVELEKAMRDSGLDTTILRAAIKGDQENNDIQILKDLNLSSPKKSVFQTLKYARHMGDIIRATKKLPAIKL